jgi:hypothetical protein
LWGTKFKWGPIIGFYRDPDYSKFIKSLVGKYGGWWSIFKIYVSLIPFKIKIFRLCMKMTKRWDYHTPENYLNKTLKEIREEFNIKLLPLDDVPVGRFLETQKN